jgi:hypothetical protein
LPAEPDLKARSTTLVERAEMVALTPIMTQNLYQDVRIQGLAISFEKPEERVCETFPLSRSRDVGRTSQQLLCKFRAISNADHAS